jgi:hypothetical protein
MKGVIRIPKSKKDRQHNDKRKRAKGQTMIYKTIDWVTRTPLKTYSCSNYYQMLLSCNTYKNEIKRTHCTE